MRRRWLWIAIGLAAGALALHAWLVVSAAPMMPVRVDPLLPDAAATPTDEHLEVARRHAPWILHETSAELGRQDIPAAMDFDGDRLGANAWEDLPRHEILPTVYYTYAETGTHVFLTYHLYHPRDWTRVPLGIQDVHEGDGENVQVVVDKATNEVVLLTTQAHYDASSYASVIGPVKSGDETLRADFDVNTGHPNVYVESGGHGIYGSRDPRAANRLARIGDPVVTYRPADPGEGVVEPTNWSEAYAYRLVSLPAFLDNRTDDADLFARFDDGVPRYHKGDRYSGPLGASRGISPFALGYSWRGDDFDDLFFDPARVYAESLEIQGAWSTDYVVRPFT